MGPLVVKMIAENRTMTEEKIKTWPDVCSYVSKDDNRLHLEIAISGEIKENINFF
jgi:hypothetical protein